MNDFWTKRLGNHTAGAGPASTTHYPAIPASMTVTSPMASRGNPKAPSSLSTKHCPECGSGNYTGNPGNATEMIRCYDCGFNPRFGTQSGAAGMSSSHSKAATPSRQVSTSNNYQPGTIVGRIGE